jgi:hypothetical protein
MAGENRFSQELRTLLGFASENGKYCTLKGSDQMQVTLAAYCYSNMVGPLLGKTNHGRGATAGRRAVI